MLTTLSENVIVASDIFSCKKDIVYTVLVSFYSVRCPVFELSLRGIPSIRQVDYSACQAKAEKHAYEIDTGYVDF